MHTHARKQATWKSVGSRVSRISLPQSSPRSVIAVGVNGVMSETGHVRPPSPQALLSSRLVLVFVLRCTHLLVSAELNPSVSARVRVRACVCVSARAHGACVSVPGAPAATGAQSPCSTVSSKDVKSAHREPRSGEEESEEEDCACLHHIFLEGIAGICST